MTCNCNRTGDIEYTIVLNQQGPQGRQGNRGQDGFSPIVDVYSNTEANYQLKIISAEGEIITPNLKGQDASLNNVAIVNETNLFSEVNRFQQNVFFNGALYVEGDGGYINFVGSSNEVRLRGSVPLVATTSIDIRDVPFKLSNGGYTTTFAKIERQLFIGGASDNNDKVFVYGTLYARREGTENVTDKVILEPEFDELANDVVAINSALGGTSFKKYTEAEYASITNPNANTLYMVTNPDGNTFKIYLGDLELPQSEGGSGGGIIATTPTDNQRLSSLSNIEVTVTAEKYVVPLTGELEVNTVTKKTGITKSGTFLSSTGEVKTFIFQADGTGELDLRTYLTDKTPNTEHYVYGRSGNWYWTVEASETDITANYLYMGKATSDADGVINLSDLIPAADNIKIITT